ncbi:MAG: DsbC/DsbD-like thiol-disulfide interchange protein/cytochrome c biogenesis protein CcdA [Rubritalea sp.]|jgi:DsbC/DsbD-like thiol-disulfide interchange protein/cytochrome c biogenesis protein CcdA
MQKSLTTLLCLASSIFIAQPAVAQLGEPVDAFGAGANDDTSTSALIISAKSIAPGETFKVAIKLTHPPKWHSYYFNDGIGISQVPAVKWTLPKGFKTSSLTFPTPHSMDSFGLNSYGYDGTNYFVTEITPPTDLTIGESFEIAADASWQICKVGCIQEKGKHVIKLTSTAATVSNPAYLEEIADYQKKYIPSQTTPTSWKISAEVKEKDIVIQISSDGKLPDDLKFYEYNGQIDAQKPITINSEDRKVTISGKVNDGNDFSPDPAKRLDYIAGILYSPSTVISGDNHSVFIMSDWLGGVVAEKLPKLEEHNKIEVAENTPALQNGELPDNYYLKYDTFGDLAEMSEIKDSSMIHTLSLDQINDDGDVIDDKGEVIEKGTWKLNDKGSIVSDSGEVLNKKKETTFFWALLLIFGGGLILNLMPCVFPVLGIKVLGFVQLSGNDPKKIKMHGIVFTIGVIVSMWILAGILLSIRAFSGEAISWGSQMQNPYFVGTMIILLALFALNLFGVFEVGTSLTSAGGKLQTKKGYEGSFFSGMLTTLIATPCGAPFLATAMAYTLQQSALVAMILFTIFALGVASPYLILSFAPALINKLPRPGAWMVTFKKSMSFLLLATCAFLLMPFIDQTGSQGIKWMNWSLVVFATAAFIYGLYSPPFISKVKRWSLGYGLSLIFAIGGGYLGHTAMSQTPPAEIAIVSNNANMNQPAVFADDKGWKPWRPGKIGHSRSKERIAWIDYTASW